MTLKREKVFHIVPNLSSFIRNDIDILTSRYDVILCQYNWQKKYLTPIFMLRQFFTLLKQIKKIKVILIQFGGHWALVPTVLGKFFNKPVIIILHGTDCANIPNIAYGSLRKRLLRKSCQISYRLATVLAPVSNSLIVTSNDYCNTYIKQGILNHFPRLQPNVKVINNGLDCKFWTAQKAYEKENNRFLTVFFQNAFFLKGGDLILELAERLPQHHFYIAGSIKPKSDQKNLINVHYLGVLTREELKIEYSKASYYLQLSMFEGFGLSLCEAMLCECIPIGSSVNEIPTIIGDTGYILKKKNTDQLVEIINKATSDPYKKELGSRARQRIISKYDLHIRKKKLLDLIHNVRA